MDSIKRYVKGQPAPPPPPPSRSNRQSKRMSIRQSIMSAIPMTIQEGSPPQPSATWESLGQKQAEEKFNPGAPAPAAPEPKAARRASRFSFIMPKESAPAPEAPAKVTNEDIQNARHEFRMSMAGNMINRRKTMMLNNEKIDFPNIVQEDEIEEDGEEEEEQDQQTGEVEYTSEKPLAKVDEEEVDAEAGYYDEEVEDSVAGTDVDTKYGNQNVNMLEELKHEIMVNYLFQQQCARLWIADGTGEVEGVMLRKSRGNYLACPPALADSMFADACVELNVQCAMTVNSRVIKTFMAWSPDAVDVPLTNGLRVQIIPTVSDLPHSKKNQFAAFIAEDALLVVWDDSVHNLVKRAKFIEDELMELVWSAGEDEDLDGDEAGKRGPGIVQIEIDPVTGEELPEHRPIMLLNAAYTSCTMIIILALVGATYRNIAIEICIDGSYLRLLFMLLTPLQTFFTLFFAQAVVSNIAEIVGPVNQVNINSKFYSALLPRRLTGGDLPHLTIQCPVYKESLESVIMPTVRSLKAAISTYELQGGTANMFFNDDGIQLLDEEERNARIDFYTDNNIGWTARPKHGSEGFVRRGKFKKASNMNFGLMLSNRTEDRLNLLERHADWNQDDEADAYGRCLQEVLDEHGRAWADGNIRIGDYILIIDSDTRVPTDCLLDAVSEMERSPQVGIMQFSSGVMQVVWTFFENGITFFTNLIYSAIKFTVANGDVAPFVGHNAILRWKAVQQVGFFDEDGYEKFWSESHVSEDFEMALRLQVQGYIVRLAAWAGDGFKEGVSLTVYDELARWEKYSFGCNEMLFNPMRLWVVKGVFTDLLKDFLWSSMPPTSKVSIMAYIGTYYGIGFAWILTTVNYFAEGWFNGYLDKYYLNSWAVWFALMVVFVCLGNVALAVIRYRLGEKTLYEAGWENLRWIPMFLVFLGGLSLHVSQALASHMFEFDMQWGSTNKEAGFSNIFTEVPMIWSKYKRTLILSMCVFAMMIILALAPFIPFSWGITTFLAWWPLTSCFGAHFLLPIVLNPALMTFSF